jgi:ribosomal protein S18 acetylase RimI-like enzyme
MALDVPTIRAAQPDDAYGMARVHVDAWRAAYRDLLPAGFLASLSYPATAERWVKALAELQAPGEAVFVAESPAQVIIAIASCGPVHDRDPSYQAEIYNLYVLPACQRQGLGRRLVAACAQHLIDQLQAQTLLVWVLAGNPYLRFYETLGGKLVRQKSVEVGGMTVMDIGYGWDELSGLVRL